MITQCCVCRRIRLGKTWRALLYPLKGGLRISHGYCPLCLSHAFAMLLPNRATHHQAH